MEKHKQEHRDYTEEAGETEAEAGEAVANKGG